MDFSSQDEHTNEVMIMRTNNGMLDLASKLGILSPRQADTHST